jgi:serine/threonine protein kinase
LGADAAVQMKEKPFPLTGTRYIRWRAPNGFVRQHTGIMQKTRLAADQTFGPYRIVSLLGAGGMGEVYSARDSRLNRTVAIKILLESLSDRPDARERFRREAQTIANLNHPNICVIHDVGQHDGLDYLVMEKLEGETLADRLERGALTAEDVLQFAIEVTDALDKVHRLGVVHRDLKPGNFMLTKSGAKLLDFGLAKLVPHREAELSAMTQTNISAEGTIAGTVPYMAPEQLQAQQVDARSDIFSLGVVLYEMLTGRSAFYGKNSASLIAAILEREPEPIQTFKNRKLKGLDYLIRKCIAKNPDDRWQSAHDLLLQLRWIGQEDADSISPPARSGISRWAALLLRVLPVVLALVFLAVVWNEKPPEVSSMRFEIYAPQNRAFYSPGKISPDGRTVAFIADSERGNTLVWVRPLNSVEAKPLPGTEDVIDPFFWSPDSKEIGFATVNHLKKISVSNGAVQALTDTRTLGSSTWGGGTWAADGTILFSPGPGQPLFRIASSGGAPSPATTLNETEEEIGHVWPHFLPDGKHFLYRARSKDAEKAGIYVGLLGSNDRKKLLAENTLPAYAPPGYLLFVRGERLFAQAFDTARLELSGDPIEVASGLEAVGWYSVSQNGVLTVNQRPWYAIRNELIWFGRKGEAMTALRADADGTTGSFFTPIVSPDGRSIAVERHLPSSRDIWVSEADRERFQRFTLEGTHDQAPVWSRDRRFLAFTTEIPNDGWRIRRKPLDRPTETEDLAALVEEAYTDDWSPDGQFIAYESFSKETQWDCWLLPVTGDRKPQPLLRTPSNERQLQFSPDGRRIAYTSNQSGRNEVYVQTFPISGATWQISSNGGAQPRWSRDGRELFYMALDQKLMAADIKTEPAFEAAPPHELFQLRVDASAGLDGIRNHYDVSADGKQFLVNTIADQRSPSAIMLIFNWTSALNGR